MPTGDGVQKRPSFEDQVKEFKGFTVREGEIVDPATENLNPVSADISEAERIAGAKTVQEAEAEGGEKPAKEADKSDTENAETSDESDTYDDADATKEAATDDESDDTRTITVAEAKKMAGKRIAELTKDKRRLERRLEGLEDLNQRLGQLEGRLTGTQPQTKEEPEAAPNPDKFDLGEMDPKYIKALARFEARQEVAQERQKDEDNRQREADTRNQRELATKKAALTEAGTKEYEDFEEVVLEGAKWSQQNKDDPDAWPLSATMFGLCSDSKAGHHVLYHLATHPDEARKVFRQSPGEQGAWFARMELKHAPPPASDAAGKPPVKTSKAPPPPRHLARGGTGRTQAPTDSKDFAAVEAAWRNQGRRPN